MRVSFGVQISLFPSLPPSSLFPLLVPPSQFLVLSHPSHVQVQRGPDWKWDDQDGGVGHTGTLVELDSDPTWARVRWGSGSTNLYRIGDGNHDLVYVKARVRTPPSRCPLALQSSLPPIFFSLHSSHFSVLFVDLTPERHDILAHAALDASPLPLPEARMVL